MEIHDQENFYSSTGSSSFHFNSFLGLLTSDDDEEDDEADANHSDQDTFIEIALQPPQIPLPPSPPRLQDQEERPLNDHEEEIQLRVSFSRRVFPLPGSQSSLCSSSDGVHGNNSSCPDDQAISSDISYTQGTQKVRFRAAMDRLLRFFPSTFNISTPRSWELLAGSSGLVGSFLVKLRATTFEMMMASLVKLRQFTSSPSPEKMSRGDIDQLKSGNAHQMMLIVKPFKKLMQNIPRGSREIERSKVSDLRKLKGRRLQDGCDGGVFNMNMKRGISSGKKTESCPPSVGSSPSKEQLGGVGSSSRSQNIHFARDNSVQAAIAHCKKSLGGVDDFHF